jgi:hypothetical protein
VYLINTGWRQYQVIPTPQGPRPQMPSTGGAKATPAAPPEHRPQSEPTGAPGSAHLLARLASLAGRWAGRRWVLLYSDIPASHSLRVVLGCVAQV